MKRALVVDDKEENIYYLKVLLEGHGWAVDSARHGAEALVLARQEPPDLVVSDLLMPVMDGYTLLRHWKADERLKLVPFVVYTATYTEREDEQLALDLGADAFILKPTEPEAFLERIRATLERATTSGAPRAPQATLGDEEAHLKHYSETLIRKLEEKTLQLEDTNRALEKDIVERKRVERALRDREAQLRLASRVARLGGWSADVPVRNIAWSDELCAIHGVPAGTSPTMDDALALYPPEFRDLIAESALRCARDGTPFDLEAQVTIADERRTWVRLIGQAERNEAGEIVRLQGTLQDIDGLRKLHDQLRQAQKMEAIGKLASGVAHDFNNMLSVILSYATLLQRQLKPHDLAYADVSEIQRAGERATHLTRQLLAFSRQQVLQPQVVDVGDLVGDMQPMLRRLLGEDVALALTTTHLLGRVLADPSQVEQIVMNLVVNARDAMPHGGTLNIKTSDVDVNDANLELHRGVTPGAYFVLSITDTGTGMDPATREQIFEPFFTTKEPGKGTGLGLATVFGIVKQSEGHITVQSEVGHGTTFSVYLLRTDRQIAPQPEALQPPTTLQGTETILLVEDDEQVRSVSCAILRRHGYQVLDASNGGEAFLICEKQTQPIDLLLTDVVMPHLNGPQLAARLAVMRPTMRVLYMTGYTDSAVVHQGVPNIGIALLRKPITPDALCLKVREVLDASESAVASSRTTGSRAP